MNPKRQSVTNYKRIFGQKKTLPTRIKFYEKFINEVIENDTIETYEIRKYKKIKNTYSNLYECQSEDGVYVVRLTTNRKKYIDVYVYFLSTKVYSVMPILKGKTIIGWI